MLLTTRLSQEHIRKGWMQIALCVILFLPLAIGFSLLYKAWPLLGMAELSDVLFSVQWSPMQGKFGLWPFIMSSLMISLIGLVIMIPICLAAAIYITQFAPAWIKNSLRSIIDILAGIPSIIFGLWGVLIIVPFIADWAAKSGAENASGYSIITGGIIVSISVMPFVLNMLIELFESVSIELKETALSLGASHWETIKDVVLTKIKPGIIASFTLGISKTFGETIAVLMVVGNVVQVPNGVFDAGYPLPALLANNYGEMMSIPLYDAALMLSAFILLVLVILFNFLAHRFIRRYQSL